MEVACAWPEAIGASCTRHSRTCATLRFRQELTPCAFCRLWLRAFVVKRSTAKAWGDIEYYKLSLLDKALSFDIDLSQIGW